MTKSLRVLSPFGIIVSVVAVNGGWTTIKSQDGTEQKTRNGNLRELTAEELEAYKAIKATASDQKAEKPAPAKKAKADPTAAQPEGDTTLNGDGSEVDEAAKGDQLVKPDYSRYTKHEVKSPSGRKALDIGDAAADALRGQDIDDCYFIVAKHAAKVKGETRTTDEIEQELKDQYAHLNIGMQRMNLGNRLRKLMGIYGNLNAHKTKAKPRSMPAKIGKKSVSATMSITINMPMPRNNKSQQIDLFALPVARATKRKAARK